jgi:hypothetical protein
MVSFTPRLLYPQRKSPWYPLDRRLGRPQSRSGRGGEEKKSQPPQGLEPPTIQPVAQRYTTELSRLNLIISKSVKNYVLRHNQDYCKTHQTRKNRTLLKSCSNALRLDENSVTLRS